MPFIRGNVRTINLNYVQTRAEISIIFVIVDFPRKTNNKSLTEYVQIPYHYHVTSW